ncbi:MAG: S24/S26 family peptidase [Candidatus Omnitrophica bacterium]|nr:S24/S26 family peptidase [Candidatus Omnitrophota bacterium]MDD5237053.1 S24/S26 family peptidase [Candidatus Omnitrophota bacterium]MDD5610504.1 S24/S26 family peptidase [Candidatus Omnitrophota bacterium]
MGENFRKDSCFWINITGRSMAPILSCGSKAKVVLCSLYEVRRGDIIVFKDEGEFVCHRVFTKVKRRENLFLKTKGDMVFNFDSLVSREALVGKVVGLRIGNLDLKIDGSVCRWTGLFFSCLLPLVVSPFFYLRSLTIKHEPEHKA